MTDLSILCPKCGHTDQVSKVSAIFKRDIVTTSGTTQTYVSGELGHFTTTQISNLAKELTPPSKPQASSTWFPFGQLIVFPLLGCVSCFCLIFVSVNYLHLVIPNFLDRWGLLIFPLLLLFIAVAVVGLAYSNYSKKKKQVEDMLPYWERAMYKWDRLYYCGRDDIIFDKDDKRPMPLTEMNRHLYS